MIKNAIPYRDTHLAPGSVAHRLHTEGKLKELEKHLAQTSSAYAILHGVRQ